MDSKEFVENLKNVIKMLEEEAAKQKGMMDAMSMNDIEWEYLYQIQKDLSRYVVEQKHTLSLYENGVI